MTLYGIWRKDAKDEKGDWYRAAHGTGDKALDGIIAFETKRAACRIAAGMYGFRTYSLVKRAGWCEVRPLTEVRR
jgi:hypothetical protein